MIPRIVVRMKPRGSLSPGVINFAMMPATKPMMMVQISDMAPSNLRRPQTGHRPETNQPFLQVLMNDLRALPWMFLLSASLEHSSDFAVRVVFAAVGLPAGA